MKVYDCHECPKKTMIRCIDQSPCLPEEKKEIWKAFAAGEDTEDMRQFLQEHCVLRRDDEERALLSGEEAGEEDEATSDDSLEEAKKPDARHLTRPLTIGQADVMPSRPTGTVLLDGLPEVEEQPEPGEALPCSLIVVSTGHRISLPDDGELVMGRIDLDFGFTPDIDLTSDTKGVHSISRRHARIIALQGRYLIEDLGSTNGTAVNGRPLNQGQRAPLRPGDHVALGLCELECSQTPRWLGIYRGSTHRAFFMVTFSGNRYYLPSQSEIILGCSDPEKGATVDVDLSGEGRLVSKTSARHARVIEDGGLYFVEDLGSTYGSKLNGSIMVAGELVPLHPGDHLCLGSCILYYDFETQVEEKETRN